MPRYRERRWPLVVAGYAVLFAVMAPATAYIYDAAAAANRPMVIRLAVVLVVGVMLLHLRGYFRGDPRWERPSEFDDALTAPPPRARLDPGFVKIRKEVADSRASRFYFEKLLWPRLCALAAARGCRPSDAPLPTERGWPFRGRSRRAAAIAGLVARIEDGGTGR
ncbi:MAG TPA: hypothetical protein VMF86_11460 [Stellaceae bacterium]|nr:hypothetical protein [Stellaceae bacterium]